MKTFFVTFYTGNNVWSANMIFSNCGVNDREAVLDTAKRRAEKFGYEVTSVEEMTEAEVKENLLRGRPLYGIDEQAEKDYDPSYLA